jgi:hypothetical protein
MPETRSRPCGISGDEAGYDDELATSTLSDVFELRSKDFEMPIEKKAGLGI